MYCIENFELTYESLVAREASEDMLEYFKSILSKKVGIQDVLKQLEKDKKNYATFLFERFILTGLCISWYDNGVYESFKSYKRSLLDGTSEGWHDNGQRAYSSNYENGVRNGLTMLWSREGHLSERLNYKNGYLDGTYESFYANGKPSLVGQCKYTLYRTEFSVDAFHGAVKTYNRSGFLQSIIRYEEGRLVLQ